MNLAHNFNLGAIATMESQIETMRATVAALKSNKSVTVKKEKKEKKREKHPAGPVASSSKVVKKEPKSQPAKKKGKKPTPVADDDVLTFEQKKDLSEAISHLDGSKLERVIAIIHEGVPEIRDVSFSLRAVFNRGTDRLWTTEPGRDRA